MTDHPDADEDSRRRRHDEVADRLVPEVWQNVIEDMEVTAEEYESEGWRTVMCHPGDARMIDGADRAGLSVLLPDNEYDTVSSLVDRAPVSNRNARDTADETLWKRDWCPTRQLPKSNRQSHVGRENPATAIRPTAPTADSLAPSADFSFQHSAIN